MNTEKIVDKMLEKSAQHLKLVRTAACLKLERIAHGSPVGPLSPEEARALLLTMGPVR